MKNLTDIEIQILLQLVSKSKNGLEKVYKTIREPYYQSQEEGKILCKIDNLDIIADKLLKMYSSSEK
tara:strand:- start:454 stop:654 length:201 start_codon:yes stop_codon:yes gene_type:complete